jgi:AcrR family transcriptional regulator
VTRKRQENPQKAISKESITSSLFSFMHEKPYKEINVTELSVRADLSRRTFYRHFDTIDDVMAYIIRDTSDLLALFFLKHKISDFKSAVFLFFTFWEQRKDFLFLLRKNDLLFMLLRLLLPETRIKMFGDNIPLDSEYIFYFSSGGAWNLLVKWLEDGAVLSPKEMEDIAEKIVMHFK